MSDFLLMLFLFRVAARQLLSQLRHVNTNWRSARRVRIVLCRDAVVEWSPHILVSDVAMPNEDGYSLIRRLRSSGSVLPAVAITAYARPAKRATACE